MQIKDIQGNYYDLDLSKIQDEMLNNVAFIKSPCSLFSGRVFTLEYDNQPIHFHLIELMRPFEEIDLKNSSSDVLREVARVISVFSKAAEAGYNTIGYVGMGIVAKAVADIKHWISSRQRTSILKAVARRTIRYAAEDAETHLNIAKFLLEQGLNDKTRKKFKDQLLLAFDLDEAKSLLLVHFPCESSFCDLSRTDILLDLTITEESPAELCYELAKYYWSRRGGKLGYVEENLEFKEKAREFFEFAYKKNHAEAAYILYLSIPGTEEEKKAWFDKAVELKHPLALNVALKLQLLEEEEDLDN